MVGFYRQNMGPKRTYFLSKLTTRDANHSMAELHRKMNKEKVTKQHAHSTYTLQTLIYGFKIWGDLRSCPPPDQILYQNSDIEYLWLVWHTTAPQSPSEMSRMRIYIYLTINTIYRRLGICFQRICVKRWGKSTV